MNAYWGPWLLYLPSMFYNAGDWDWPARDTDAMQVANVSYWPTRLGEPTPK